MFCTNCGNNIPDDSSFCPNCGTPVKMRPDTSGVQPNPNLQNTGTTFGAAQGPRDSTQICLPAIPRWETNTQEIPPHQTVSLC